KMGTELGELFSAASDELMSMHWRWNQYRILFGESEQRIDFLNEVSPFFFRLVHDVLFEDCVLAVARIVAPPRSYGKPNLTITRFPDAVTPDLKAQVSELVVFAQKSAAFALDWRHRHLAHRSLDLARQNAKVQPLRPISRAQIEDILSALRQVLDCIEAKYCN